MKGMLTILGSGAAGGVPLITNKWGVCDPDEPKNKRMRASVAVTSDTTTVIVDTGPDFLHQFNRANLKTPKAVIYTHEHSDHVAGIDELRTLQRLKQRKFDIYSNRKTLNNLHERYDYMFEDRDEGFYPAVCEPHELAYGQSYQIGDIAFNTYEMDHTTLSSVGLRFGNVGYSVDFKKLDDTAIEALKGIDTWIADCAGYNSDTNPVHAGLNELYRINEIVQAKAVYLTHMPPTMDYQTLLSELPEGYKPAYDGLQVEITWP